MLPSVQLPSSGLNSSDRLPPPPPLRRQPALGTSYIRGMGLVLELHRIVGAGWDTSTIEGGNLGNDHHYARNLHHHLSIVLLTGWGGHVTHDLRLSGLAHVRDVSPALRLPATCTIFCIPKIDFILPNKRAPFVCLSLASCFCTFFFFGPVRTPRSTHVVCDSDV